MEIFSYIVNGWSPIISLVSDGARIVMKVVGWTGGTGGNVPASDVYIGATGYVADIADAVDVKGNTGATGAAGATGATGATGAGVAPGGAINQALTKIDSTNYNTQWTTIDKTFVGLGNVDNTSDSAKPVSTAQQTALNLKADIASPTFTGTVGGITATMVGLGNVPNVDTTNANNISSGTLPDGRFPATLPAASGVNLTALNASSLGSGTVPDARLQYIISILAASFAATNNVTNGATQYISPVSGFANFNASEAIRIWTVPPGLTGTIRDFIITTNGTQPSTGSLVITFRKNASNASITVTIAANAAQGDFQDTTNSFSITGGDKISIQGVNNASTASTAIIAISFKVTNY